MLPRKGAPEERFSGAILRLRGSNYSAATSGPRIAGFVVLVRVLFRTGAAGHQRDGPILRPTRVEQWCGGSRLGRLFRTFVSRRRPGRAWRWKLGRAWGGTGARRTATAWDRVFVSSGIRVSGGVAGNAVVIRVQVVRIIGMLSQILLRLCLRAEVVTVTGVLCRGCRHKLPPCTQTKSGENN